MDDLLVAKRKKRTIAEIPIAPILDMLVAIIFFLLLSTTFVEFTRQTVPPARVSTIHNPLRPAPLTPKLVLMRLPSQLKIILSWEGPSPGHTVRILEKSDMNADSWKEIRLTASKLVADFLRVNPDEKSLQIGFSKQAVYQDVITVMDGAREHISDLVLMSYDDAMEEMTRL